LLLPSKEGKGEWNGRGPEESTKATPLGGENIFSGNKGDYRERGRKKELVNNASGN